MGAGARRALRCSVTSSGGAYTCTFGGWSCLSGYCRRTRRYEESVKKHIKGKHAQVHVAYTSTYKVQIHVQAHVHVPVLTCRWAKKYIYNKIVTVPVVPSRTRRPAPRARLEVRLGTSWPAGWLVGRSTAANAQKKLPGKFSMDHLYLYLYL